MVNDGVGRMQQTGLMLGVTQDDEMSRKQPASRADARGRVARRQVSTQRATECYAPGARARALAHPPRVARAAAKRRRQDGGAPAVHQNGNRTVVTTTACGEPPLNRALRGGLQRDHAQVRAGKRRRAQSRGGVPHTTFKGGGFPARRSRAGAPLEGMSQGTI